MTIDDLNKACGVLCAWREADDQGNDGMRAVLHVINNRSLVRNQTWAQVVYAKEQFTSMTVSGELDIYRVPLPGDAAFDYLCSIVDAVYANTDPDNTNGATNYYSDSISPPYWVASMTFTVQIKDQLFYK